MNTVRRLVVFMLAMGCWMVSAKPFDNAKRYLSLTINPDEPGVAYIVTQRERVLLSGGVGLADLQSKETITDDTLFRIASLTKQVTSAAILLLEQRGQLRLNDDITRYLPDFPAKGRGITIEHLLTHTAGLGRNPAHTTQRRTQPVEMKRLMSLIAEQPFLSEPGERFRYSNMGYNLLGRIIEVVSGQSYGDFVEQQLLIPVGLSSIGYADTPITQGMAQGYYKTRRGTFTPDRDIVDVSWAYAAGGLMSSVKAFARWHHALVSGRVVDAEVFDRMSQRFQLNNGHFSRYGYGLNNIVIHGQKAVIHQGGTPGYRTSAVYFPEGEYTIIVFSNDGSLNTMDVVKVLSAPLFDVAMPRFLPGVLTSERQHRITGDYRMNDGSRRTLFVEEGKVYSRVNDGMIYPLTLLTDDTLLFDNDLSYITITQDKNGKTTLKLTEDNRRVSQPQTGVKVQSLSAANSGKRQ